jgi:hypothetical protein
VLMSSLKIILAQPGMHSNNIRSSLLSSENVDHICYSLLSVLRLVSILHSSPDSDRNAGDLRARLLSQCIEAIHEQCPELIPGMYVLVILDCA